ncbi:MAG: hypothetical protein KME49_16550 [Brasilonema octagenarum HA4186-MV1]|nr:hypothetical protein [Brasilonema octagenarum HA4186-MV1]
MTIRRKKEIAGEVKNLCSERKKSAQRADDLTNLAEQTRAEFETLSPGNTEEVNHQVNQAYHSFKSTIESSHNDNIQETQKISDHLEDKRIAFQQAIASNETDINQLNTIENIAQASGVNKRDIVQAQDIKHEDNQFLGELKNQIEENNNELYNKISTSQKRRESARTSYKSKTLGDRQVVVKSDTNTGNSKLSREDNIHFHEQPNYEKTLIPKANQAYQHKNSNFYNSWANLKTSHEERNKFREKIKGLPGMTTMSNKWLNEAERKNISPPPYPEELAALMFYTCSDEKDPDKEGYRQINRLLRREIKDLEENLYPWQDDPEQAKKDYLEQARFAVAALNELPDYRFVAFRGSAFTAEQISQYKVGTVYTERAFTSCSTGIAETEKFAQSSNEPQKEPVRFTIFSRTGKLVQEFSPFPNEKEVIFRPETRFKVLAVEKESGKTIIRLVELETDGTEWWKNKNE